LTVHGYLEIEYTFTPTATGCDFAVTQRISFQDPLLDKLLNHRWLWPAVGRHIEEESAQALAIFTDPDLAPSPPA
jgi:hypothetical protein